MAISHSAVIGVPITFVSLSSLYLSVCLYLIISSLHLSCLSSPSSAFCRQSARLTALLARKDVMHREHAEVMETLQTQLRALDPMSQNARVCVPMQWCLISRHFDWLNLDIFQLGYINRVWILAVFYLIVTILFSFALSHH